MISCHSVNPLTELSLVFGVTDIMAARARHSQPEPLPTRGHYDWRSRGEALFADLDPLDGDRDDQVCTDTFVKLVGHDAGPLFLELEKICHESTTMDLARWLKFLERVHDVHGFQGVDHLLDWVEHKLHEGNASSPYAEAHRGKIDPDRSKELVKDFARDRAARTVEHMLNNRPEKERLESRNLLKSAETVEEQRQRIRDASNVVEKHLLKRTEPGELHTWNSEFDWKGRAEKIVNRDLKDLELTASSTDFYKQMHPDGAVLGPADAHPGSATPDLFGAGTLSSFCERVASWMQEYGTQGWTVGPVFRWTIHMGICAEFPQGPRSAGTPSPSTPDNLAVAAASASEREMSLERVSPDEPSVDLQASQDLGEQKVLKLQDAVVASPQSVHPLTLLCHRGASASTTLKELILQLGSQQRLHKPEGNVLM